MNETTRLNKLRKPQIAVRGLDFAYPGTTRKILQSLDLQVEGGRLICLLGANGAGKTTLFKLILGHLKKQAEAGEIRINGCDPEKMSHRELARMLAYIPQIQRFRFSYSVIDMVLMGTTASFSFWSQPGPAAYDCARQALRLLNIEAFAERSFAELSGGEQQLVLIARAVAQNTKILLMDEPCSNLDYGNQMRVLRTVKELAQSGYLVFLSTHTPEHAMIFADEVLLMENGRVVEQGAPESVMRAETLSRLYGIPLCERHTAEDGRLVIAPDLEAWSMTQPPEREEHNGEAFGLRAKSDKNEP